MKKICKYKYNYFTTAEILLWAASVLFISVFFCIFDRQNFSTFLASLIGVTSLIFNAKGNPFGQILMIIFSIFYGYISFGFRYYGEMLTYLGMTLPMSITALFTWLKNPYGKSKSAVRVSSVGKREAVFMSFLTLMVTIVFYFVLGLFGTANLFVSTLSVATSFAAAYLTCRRSPYFALLYASNDIVLIIMWIMASFADSMYVSVVICFIVFLANDLYCFFNWQKMKKIQSESSKDTV